MSTTTAKGLDNSDVDLGSGNDRLSVNASSSGSNSQATAVENSDIDTGAGNDSVSINANARSNGGGWDGSLRGRSLTYYKTSSGYSVKKHMSFCSDGTFRYSSDEGYLSGGFSAAGAGGDAGDQVATSTKRRKRRRANQRRRRKS